MKALFNYRMEKITKILSILIFTILLLIIGNVIWAYFNPYAKVMLIPLAFLSVYYLLLFLFTKLINNQKSKFFNYLVVAMIVVPLISLSYGYNAFIKFSITLLNQISS